MARACTSMPSLATTCRRLALRQQLPKPTVSIRAQPFPTSQASRRSLSNTPTRWAGFRTVEQAKARQRIGPFSVYSGLFFLVSGFGVYYYFQSEKDRLNRKRTREASKGAGKPRIGGDFELVDQNGRKFSSEDLKGKFSLIYFGFTHCPDICPDELDKMAKMINQVRDKRGNVLNPLFITCDPARDTPPVIKGYLSEFHPDLIGLTGSWEQVKATCKAYRVYFSTPPHVQPGQDYLVDHSIYFYLMDPEGDFIEVIGRQHTAGQGSKIIADHIDSRMGRKTTSESWKEKKPTDLAFIKPRTQAPM